MFHISLGKINEKDLLFVPRIPKTAGNGENKEVPRICLSETFRGCIDAILSSHIHAELMRCRAWNETKLDLFVYTTASEMAKDVIVQSDELVSRGYVLDAKRTKEMWLLCPTKMKLHTVLEVTNVTDSFQWLDFADFSFEEFPFQIEFIEKEISSQTAKLIGK